MNPAVKVVLGVALILAGYCVEDAYPGINKYLFAVTTLTGIGSYCLIRGILQINMGDYDPPPSELEGEDLIRSNYYRL